MDANDKEVIAAEVVQKFSSDHIRAFSGLLTVSEKGF